MTAAYYYHNQDELQTEIFEDHLPDKSIYELEQFQSAVRGFFRRTNNSKLMSFVRKLGINLEKAESERYNNRALNYIDWFAVTTQLRHGTTHKLDEIDKKGLDKLSENQRKLLQEVYPGEFKENIYKLKLTPKSAKTALSRYVEYGFAIFKSLSLKHGYKWEFLLKNKPANLPAYNSGAPRPLLIVLISWCQIVN